MIDTTLRHTEQKPWFEQNTKWMGERGFNSNNFNLPPFLPYFSCPSLSPSPSHLPSFFNSNSLASFVQGILILQGNSTPTDVLIVLG